MKDDYPRMMFHREKDPVTIYSEEQETALGGEWSRTIPSAQPTAREENSKVFARVAAAEYQTVPAKPKRSHHKGKR